jgi:predicted  nucleic acid-binding Zn-ribbon protein
MSSSSSNVSLDVLRTLHRIHRQLNDLRERLDRGPKQAHAGEVNVKHREEDLARLHEELKAMRKGADQKQLQLKATEEKIKDLQRKLNMATSNREYQILKEQIAADEMANSVLEDEILEALEQTDAHGSKLAEAEIALAAARQRTAEIHAQIGKQEPHLLHDIQRLEGELRQCEADLPPTIREVYQRMVRQRGEDALAAVVDGCCGGCNQQVPLNIQAEIRLCHPTFCRTCGRLLYLPEDATPARVHEQ